MTGRSEVAIHVDPACPWAWLTSRWLAEVERVRAVRVTTRLFVLAEINRDHEADQRLQRIHAASEAAMRVMVVGRREGGDAALSRIYTEIGEAHHERGEPLDAPETLQGALIAAGLDPALAPRALADPTTRTELFAEHRDIAARGAFGVPTLVLNDAPPTFGPIVDTRLSGEAAGELWDRVAWLLTAGAFLELKRNRPRRPNLGRHRLAQTAAS
jgi:predicted DsbA family dithiol-disulfide isomerase